MSARSVGRASTVRPATNEKMVSATTPATLATAIQKQNSGKKTNQNTTRCSTRSCSFRLPKRKELSPLKYIKQIGGKMVAILQYISHRNSPKVTSSSEKGKSFVAPAVLDSHRAEAIDDCIEFINSSSSFPRSNSVTR